MKKLQLICFGLAVIASGCAPYSINQQSIVPPALAEPVDPPQKPAVKPQTPTVKTEKAPAAVKSQEPAVKPQTAAENKTPDKSVVPPPPKKIPARRPEPQNPERHRGPWVWRAFSRLPVAEKQELIKLQRKDPERYREIMRKKAEELYQKEQARRKEFAELSKKFNQTADAGQKELIKAELRKKLQEEFKQRLQDTRADIESYKRRTAHLEKELQKREKNCDAIVDLLLTRHLQGTQAAPGKSGK